jgi:sphingosine kinase
MSYMAADTNFFPATLPSDGLMDLVCIDGHIARTAAVDLMLSVENNKFFDKPLVSYRKVLGYRIVPREQESGYISIDGERVPFEPFQAEIHRGLGTVLSCSGWKYEAQGP